MGKSTGVADDHLWDALNDQNAQVPTVNAFHRILDAWKLQKETVIQDGILQTSLWLNELEFEPTLKRGSVWSFFSLSLRIVRWIYFFASLAQTDPESEKILADITPSIEDLTYEITGRMVVNIVWMWLAGCVHSEGAKVTDEIRHEPMTMNIAIPRISHAYRQFLERVCNDSLAKVRPLLPACYFG